MDTNLSPAQHHASPQHESPDESAEAAGDVTRRADSGSSSGAIDTDDLEFDEEWYLSRYPDVAMDVAMAVRRGHGWSGLAHYLAHGRKEGRMPVPPPGATRTVSGGPSEQMADLAHAADLGPRARHMQHIPVRLPQGIKDRLSKLIERRAGDMTGIDFLTSSALLKAADGHFEAAELDALEAFRVNAANQTINSANFTAVLTALFVVQRLDLVAHMVRARYAPALEIEIRIEEDGPGVRRLRWEIDPLGHQRFIFDATLLRPEYDFRELEQFNRMCPLLFNYALSPRAESGVVILNQHDLGITPGLCYSDSRPGYFLIPDHIFVSTRGYQHVRDYFKSHPVAWPDRSPVAFWRGATSGIPPQPNAWRTLERIRLCELAEEHQESGLFDIGISQIAQFSDPATIGEIEASGLVRGAVPWENWNSYKYLVDIDGNSSPWSNLFQRLLTGSVVLKVDSYRGLRQWFYADLIAWDNYVPIASDLSDLIDKVGWLIRHDSIAERIGQRGHELALSLTYESELARSIPIIASAFRENLDETTGLCGPRSGSTQVVAGEVKLPSKPTQEDVNIALDSVPLTAAPVNARCAEQSLTDLQPSPLRGGQAMPTTAAETAAEQTRASCHAAVMRALYGRNIWRGYVPSRPTQGAIHGWNGRWESFVTLLRQAPSKVFIDVGVWKGQSSIYVAQLIQRERMDGCVISVDTFLGSPENWSADQEVFDQHVGQFERHVGQPDLFQTFIENVYYNGVADLVVPMPQTSLLAASILKTRGIMAGMAHIDASHAYEDAIRDYEAYWLLVEPGGYMVGDDYSKNHPGVFLAANEFADKHGLRLSAEGPKWWVQKPK